MLFKKSQVNTSLNSEAKATEGSKPAGLAYSFLTRTRTGWHLLSIQRLTSPSMPAKIKELQQLFRVNTILTCFFLILCCNRKSNRSANLQIPLATRIQISKYIYQGRKEKTVECCPSFLHHHPGDHKPGSESR